MKKPLKILVIFLSLYFIFPLLGVYISGGDPGGYLSFPPITKYMRQESFNPLLFIAVLSLISLVLLPFMIKYASYALRRKKREAFSSRPFPWWGWLSLSLCALSWYLAWTRHPWFSSFQPHTFFPLWFFFILVVNGLTVKRSGKSMLTSRPFYFLFLFPLSSIFWWTFEFLNRFVNNWYYTGGENYSGVEYLIFASLPFSTVLPAVMGTKEFLLTFQGMKEGFSDFIPISPRRPRLLSWSSLVLCSLGLVFLGIVPGIAYPLVWLSPLFLIVSLKQLFDEKHVFSGLGVGNWTPVISSAIAALICGVFWEMWNYHSMARWVYSFPGLYRYKIFEMPILGFAGYLPFGLICQSFASLFESCFAGEEH